MAVRGVWRVRRVPVLLIAVHAAGCRGGVEPVREPDVRSFVTGAAAAAVDNNGAFVFTNAPPNGAFVSINEGRAVELAAAFIRTFAWPDYVIGSPLGAALEKQHGAAIDARLLKARGAVVLADSPYLDADPGSASFQRNLFGPRYLIRLHDGSGPAIGVAVSAYAADVQVKDGNAILPAESGAEFQAYGNPYNKGYMNPVGPERAVVSAATATHTQVVEVPQLLLPERRFSFVNARWRVVLAREACFVNTATRDTAKSRVVYVGTALTSAGAILARDALFLPAAVQADEDTASTNPLVLFRRRPGVPILFERVEPIC